MALQAKTDFPEIDFFKSVMVGDSLSDMEFGFNVGMKTIIINQDAIDKEYNCSVDLLSFASAL
jgi:D-glycero-D-manno-heptose 1,7-bisphosphate phosphatase